MQITQSRAPERPKKKLTVQPPLFPEEPNLALGVAPHQRDDDGLLFAALEPVDAAELDARELVLKGGEDRKLGGWVLAVSIHTCPHIFHPMSVCLEADDAVPLRSA